ncbi:polysaccharide deacetylase family protein [Nonomuraea sp. C10]|uniref:polysaccharide deacetylase family protein n=1 Tax=Nonomuraea sp. C10 TaxID=2600577 RepID=UPI0011CE238A|nr:polysaccharide deacetylase family protein [Nonomuraea sp. C10]TXK35946.1 polysaccharide deacetylase family protein [Nonomuraea sp. C10]
MRLRFIGGVGAVAVAVIVSGCGSEPVTQVKDAKADSAAKQQLFKAAQAKAAAAVKANELGQVPVLMYHRIVDKPGTTDDRTPAQFRTELERLAKENYVPVTAAEFVTGKIDIPAGKHPVVLTFDDSSPSQLTLDAMGTPKANTAVAIMREVAAKHSGFRPVATFYITRDMFGKHVREEQAQTLLWLKSNGFDLGNHTRDHYNLRARTHDQVEEQIGSIGKEINELAGVKPVTIALPYGVQPRKKEWAARGKSYHHQGVFLAGYTPAASPFSKSFDALGIPRIRAMDKKGDCAQFCSTAWLDWLKANPDMRYTSDGDPSTVAYPKFKNPFLRASYKAKALAY